MTSLSAAVRFIPIVVALTAAACSGANGAADGGGGGGGRGGASGGGGTGAGVDSGGGTNSVALHFSWSLRRVGAGGGVVDCQTANAAVIEVDVSGPNLPRVERWFEDCASPRPAGGAIIDIPPGTYTATFGIRDSVFDTQGFLDIWTELTFDVPAGATDVVIPTGEIVYAQYDLTWTINKASTPSTCAGAGAGNVAIIRKESGTTLTARASCSQNPSRMQMNPGTYTVEAELYGAAATPLATWKMPEPLVITRTSANEIPPFVFNVP